MARKGFQATIGASLGNGEYVVSSANGGAAKQDATTAATLAAAIAAAQLIGTGDASVEIDAVDAAYVALAVDNPGHVALTYDTSAVTSINQLRRAVAAILRQAESSGV